MYAEDTVKLERIVEMLQWVETRIEEESDGDEKRYRYEYEQKWLSHKEDSSNFANHAYKNPSHWPIEKETFIQSTVYLAQY